MSQREFKSDKGYITFAFGKEYLKLAYAQALSIKATQKITNYAVIVDKTAKTELEKFSNVFDQVIEVDYEATSWDMSQHWRLFGLTPWKETVLVDADIIFTKSVDHWWDAMRLKDICITKQVKDFRENIITSRKHRKLFDENLLPDVYAGFLYFRYSQLAMEFFLLLRLLSENWQWIADDHLVKNDDKRIRLDELFSIATRIFGIQNVTLPVNIPTFVHGKEALWGLSEQQPWYSQLFVELNGDNLLVGHYPQRMPFHYHHKEWITDDVIGQLERNYEKFFKSN
jgi:hypothetical protein